MISGWALALAFAAAALSLAAAIAGPQLLMVGPVEGDHHDEVAFAAENAPDFRPAAVEFRAPDAAVAELLGRSPFDQSRRAFSRTQTSEAPPEPPPPPPRILGIQKKGEGRTAMVEWPATGQIENLGLGMETSLGVVARIDAQAITFIKDGVESTVSMFE